MTDTLPRIDDTVLRTNGPIMVDTRVMLTSDAPSRPRPVPLGLRATRTFFGAAGRLFPEATGRLAERMFFSPRRHRMPRREQDWMEGATEEFLDIEGHRIATYT